MTIVGTVESLWRYPVKSMCGEELEEAFVGFGGIRGDRLFAFSSSAARPDFPYFTARDQHQMLRYRPSLRTANEQIVDVETPTGKMIAIDDPALIQMLRSGTDARHQLTLLRSSRALTDCHPISIISLQTVRKLAEETETPADKRRFRANIYLDLATSNGFAEDELVGRSLRIGPNVVVSVVKRDSRCMMITLDPDTAAIAPSLLKRVAHAHGGTAGIYGTVEVEGTVRQGDSVDIAS